MPRTTINRKTEAHAAPQARHLGVCNFTASQLDELMAAPERLAEAADCAKRAGRPDAVRRLADLAEHIASGAPLGALDAQETPSGDAS